MTCLLTGARDFHLVRDCSLPKTKTIEKKNKRHLDEWTERDSTVIDHSAPLSSHIKENLSLTKSLIEIFYYFSRMSIPQPLQPSHAVTPNLVPFVDLPRLPFPRPPWRPPPKVATITPPVYATAVATPAWALQLAWILYSITLKARNPPLRSPLQFPTGDPFNTWKKLVVLSWLYSFSFLTLFIGLGCWAMRILIMPNSPQHNNNKSNYKKATVKARQKVKVLLTSTVLESFVHT